ncbi:MAG: pilus assembly protein PilM [Patescibacteria group bacterium]|nr:pilus assembly protein PilM [Patescibacteria group bacterium]
MFRKSFISIFFHKNKLYVVQLSSDKKKIKKHISIPIDNKIIVDDRVKDTSLLSKVIADVWEKMKFKEKFVAIVIPEYCAFTKLIKVPKMPNSELHEAVLLQSQEFLPSEKERFILDWKIVDDFQDEYEVLVVVVKESLLFGYIRAVEKAGLFPLLVEIPSLSLSRLIGYDESVIMVYVLDQSVIIIFSKKGKVIASSVLSTFDFEEIFVTVKRILNHYKDVQVDSIKVSGDLNGNAEFVLESLSKICPNTSYVDLSFGGFTRDEAQDYLIPLSMQTAKPSDPLDVYTINLLPEELVVKYKNKGLRLRLWGLLLSITFFIWICLFSALGVYLYLNKLLVNFEKLAIKSDITKEQESALKNSQEIISVTTKVLNIKNATSSPIELLSIIEKASPKGVAVREYKLNFDKGQVNIKGIAPNRLSLIEFKQNLGKSENVQNVQVPISSFEVDANLEFDISFSYITNATKIEHKNDKQRQPK